jgi:NAD(P)-dependent dehydrogenase (short-subunit alcohol dehydrogenase family)
MFEDLRSKTALVTGAYSGLGRHFALTLARAGAAVALCGRRTQLGAELERQIQAEGGRAAVIGMDVTDPASVPQAFDAAAARLGPISIVVNNAGVAKTQSALDTSEADWAGVIDVNLSGAWRVAQAAARHMRQQAGFGESGAERPGAGLPANTTVSAGPSAIKAPLVSPPGTAASPASPPGTKASPTIINIASLLGLRVASNVSAYAASKAALIQLTRALALEWARYGIRVNALAPGYIETDLNREFFASAAGQALIKRIPQRRLGQLTDLDGPLLLLASDASAFMTGSVLDVSGGHLVSSI